MVNYTLMSVFLLSFYFIGLGSAETEFEKSKCIFLFLILIDRLIFMDNNNSYSYRINNYNIKLYICFL